MGAPAPLKTYTVLPFKFTHQTFSTTPAELACGCGIVLSLKVTLIIWFV